MATSWAVPVGGFKTETAAWVRGTQRAGDMIETLRADSKSEFQYLRKLEMHEDGWPHWHLSILYRGTLDLEKLIRVWGLGGVEIQRVRTQKVDYLLKNTMAVFDYITKENAVPAWVGEETVIRVVQPSRAYFETAVRASVRGLGRRKRKQMQTRFLGTIAERRARYRREATVQFGTRSKTGDGPHGGISLGDASGYKSWQYEQMRRVVRWLRSLDDWTTAEWQCLAKMDCLGPRSSQLLFDTENDQHMRWLRSHLEHAPPEIVIHTGSLASSPVRFIPRASRNPGRGKDGAYKVPRQLALFSAGDVGGKPWSWY